MAHTEQLPVYKSAHDLCLWLEQVVRGFSRYHKYSILYLIGYSLPKNAEPAPFCSLR